MKCSLSLSVLSRSANSVAKERLNLFLAVCVNMASHNYQIHVLRLLRRKQTRISAFLGGGGNKATEFTFKVLKGKRMQALFLNIYISP